MYYTMLLECSGFFVYSVMQDLHQQLQHHIMAEHRVLYRDHMKAPTGSLVVESMSFGPTRISNETAEKTGVPIGIVEGPC